ncbi:hypothetical protein ACIBI3_39925 [Actinomadura luteofluorescens]|uniref:hypothetical protein n=1 Tax=Actinomadura luteofluorescens TaxID=46163 RepID=UPI0034748130
MRTPVRAPALLAASALAASGAALVPLATPALARPRPHAIVVRGPDNVYDQAFRDAKTKVAVVRDRHRTWVSLRVWGMPREAAGRTFGAHVHVNRCGPKPEDAGPHYHDPDAPPGTPMPEMEIWLDVTVRPDGRGHSRTSVPWRVAAKAAESLVVHAKPTDPKTGDAGARLICTTVPF